MVFKRRLGRVIVNSSSKGRSCIHNLNISHYYIITEHMVAVIFMLNRNNTYVCRINVWSISDCHNLKYIDCLAPPSCLTYGTYHSHNIWYAFVLYIYVISQMISHFIYRVSQVLPTGLSVPLYRLMKVQTINFI